MVRLERVKSFNKISIFAILSYIDEKMQIYLKFSEIKQTETAVF